ncbi:S9 family peptidase [Streptomyces sp. MUM 203J]|uniref:S9 family peptidase n=1 Tax=Streptomyces sp. MUM 203J TaxID=2791990 RepID=UPI001F04E0AF|nr:prolyl oligopeptidase family serine peptidase [Streptomyces sp. MUM 203J]MCH0541013.1 S9 family peptidase [Streptomyces sp. MUM 203J]
MTSPPSADTSEAPPAVPGFPRILARSRRFSLGVPGRFAVSPDGTRVLFVRTGSGTDPVGRLWLFTDGVERLLADPVALAPSRVPSGDAGDADVPEEESVRRERARDMTSGLVDYAADRDVRLAAFALGGVLWAVRTEGGAPRRIPTAGPVVDPRPSPDGTCVAYVSGGALRVVGADGTGDRALAVPETPDVTYGLVDHVSAESIGRSRAYWWSPDGDALLVVRVDHARVERWFLADPANPARPPRVLRHPAAGTANPEVTAHVLTLDGDRTAVRLPAAADPGGHPGGTWTDTRYEYVTAAGWDAHGPFVEAQTRDQRTAVLLAVDPGTGAARPLRTRRDDAWVPLLPGTPARTARGALVVPAVRGDTCGLEIGGAVSPTGVQVREVVGVSGEQVFFTASAEPTQTHVWTYGPEAGFRQVTGEPGLHTAAVGGGTVVVSSATRGGRTATVLRDGRPTAGIGVVAERPPLSMRVSHLSLGARRLRGHLHLPSWYEPGSGAPLPVLLSPYGGPGLQLAVEAYGWPSAVAQWFAEQGFAVLVTDGRGTPGRGRAWEVAVRGDRLGPALEDQVDALHAAAERFPGLDLGRVGIRGWSYGGYLALGAVLRRPEVFHAAVAGAAPADRRLYDTHWEERFLGHPEADPDAYARSSLVSEAPRLSRPLMLVHGLADDNVVAAHTLRLSSALLAAGRPHTVLPLPGATHRVMREEVVAGQLRLEVGFLKRSLGV